MDEGLKEIVSDGAAAAGERLREGTERQLTKREEGPPVSMPEEEGVAG